MRLKIILTITENHLFMFAKHKTHVMNVDSVNLVHVFLTICRTFSGPEIQQRLHSQRFICVILGGRSHGVFHCHAAETSSLRIKHASCFRPDVTQRDRHYRKATKLHAVYRLK